ncbi:hypothetical protein [Sporosarcina newyorkensis]|uniref:PilX N-terminal n=1 Tax=Sporosarcina newyorkensis TaxID=759851 RepID=A0A1T4XN87_9BACL|nr:hypothetical protein [Sporosarcina newyorkensis]SKA90853.1 hypothetical protein SAMN04244570_1029 [Sporosarcina newyorkensis]
MVYQKNEKGYALIIVLFAIVFITIITAVFMRGALNNAAQEKTMDNNNLAIVAAESGIDYYSFELKKAYDEKELNSLLTNLLKNAVQDMIDKKKTSIDYNEIQEKLADRVIDNLIDIIRRIDLKQQNNTYDMSDDYEHILLIESTVPGRENVITPLISEQNLENGQTKITLTGKALGKQKNVDNQKDLAFVLAFYIPNIELLVDGNLDEDDNSNGFDDILIPKDICKNTVKIENENCLFLTNKTSDLEYITKKSLVYLNGDYSGWKSVKIEDSTFRMANMTSGSYFDIRDSNFYVKGNLSKHGNTKLQDSTTYIGGNFAESGSIDFQKSNITIGGMFGYQSSQNNKIQDSVMKVGLDFNSPNLVTIQGTHLTVGGMMKFNSGGILEYSNLKIGEELNAPSKLYTKNSQLAIGRYLQLNSGADFQDTKMIIGSYLNSPQVLDIKKSEISIGDYLQINTPSKFRGANISIGGKFGSPVKIEIQDSSLRTSVADIGALNLQNSKFCAETFKVRDLNMQNSKIYYVNSSSHTGKDIIKLSKQDFEETCKFYLKLDDPKQPTDGLQKPEVPQAPDADIKWEDYKPNLENVTY